MSTVKYTNCNLIRNGKIIKEDLWIRNGKIINPEPIFYKERIQPTKIVNCNNLLIVPGFIDTQINGGYGWDFSSEIENIDKAISIVRKKILESGVTAFCPTIVTSPKKTYHEILPKIKNEPGGKHGAEILGVHLEGPFISPTKKGAHSEEHILILKNGINTMIDTYGTLDNVSIITIAPELKHSDEVVKALSARNIVVSLGHSEGNLEDGERAAKNGASFITHLFNAMLPFHHRDPGLVGLLTSKLIPSPMFYGIVADGKHTHPAALRIAHRTHPRGLILVTDAMAALGLEEGRHRLGEKEVNVVGKEAKISGTNILAGAIAPMDECIRHFVKAAAVDIVDGIEAATLHPAHLLGIEDRKGSLKFGNDADFVMLDIINNNINVFHTYIGGQCVYSKHGFALEEIK